MSKPSAYELIKANIGADGKLPHTFSLEEKPDPSQIGFMPGAMDGIGVFHAGGGSEKKIVKEVSNLLKKHFQHTLTKRRLEAFYIATSLIEKELWENET